MELIVQLIFVMTLGLLLGSFANAAIYRIPREIPLGLTKNMRSQCPNCQAIIRWYDNIPLLSYLLLGGKCRSCTTKIPFRYFFVELVTAILFGVVFFIYAESMHRPHDHAGAYIGLFRDLYFMFTLVVIIFIDIDFRIIPDRFSIGNWVLAWVLVYWAPPPQLIDSLIGGVCGFMSFFLLAWGYEKLKGVEGLGFGDVKMMGWLGAWLGWRALPPIVLVASLTGLIAGLIAMKRSKDGMQTAIPFGPFLALGAIVAWVLSKL